MSDQLATSADQSEEKAQARPVRRGLKRFTGARAAALIPQARLGGPMPWVIAIMIALTSIASAGGLALHNIAASTQAEISGGLTVQIVEANRVERDRQADLAVSLLRKADGVQHLRRVPDEELHALVAPWLGDLGEAGNTIPTPALIDVQLDGAATSDRTATIAALLAKRVPAARVDTQASWLTPVFGAIASLQWLAIGLVVLLAVTSAAAVWLAARSALGSNRETIQIVHLLGGTDKQIARIFQRSIGFDAALGGAVGLALGTFAVKILGDRFSALGSGMVAGGTMLPTDWLILAAIPFIGVVLAMITARLTVLSELRRSL